MDPASAFSVAAAAIQFIDFSTRLISKSREIKNSINGMTVEHAQIRAATDNITDQCKTLSRHVGRGSSQAQPLPGEETLIEIVRQCSKFAEELRIVLNELRMHKPGNKFKSFRQAIKCLWSKDRISDMRSTLNDLRSLLMVSLLIVMRFVSHFLTLY